MAGKTALSSAASAKAKWRPCSRTKLRFVQTTISFASLAACFAYLYVFDALLQIGQLYQSLVILILFLAELMKCVVNRKILNVNSCIKASELPGQNQPNTIKGPSVSKKLTVFFYSSLLLGAAVVFAAFVCILFGAPLLTDLDKTLALAVQLTTVSILPFVLFIGPSGTIQYILCDNFVLATKNQTGYLDLMHYNAVFTLFGAWASSAAAPLDWDRPWQAYPVPNMCGALVGLLVGNLYTFTLAIFASFKKRTESKRSD